MNKSVLLKGSSYAGACLLGLGGLSWPPSSAFAQQAAPVAPGREAHPSASPASGAVLSDVQPPQSPPAPPALGSSAPSAPTSLGEIIVTAQKRSERINDVPLSITAASGEQLAKLGITNTSELTRIVPGFTYQTSEFGVPIFGIRGVSFYDVSASASPAVSVYVDQVPIPYSLLTLDAPLDVERVEVLKGPQGTLFGENSTAGAINYIPARPTHQFESGGDLTYGRFNELDVGGYVSGPLTDTLGARLAVRTEQRDNWQYSTSRNASLGQRDFNEGRLLLDWRPLSALRLELNINGYVDRSDTVAPQYTAFTPAIPNGYLPETAFFTGLAPTPNNARAADWDDGRKYERDNRFFQAALRADYSLRDDLTLTSISSIIKFNGSSPSEGDGTAFPENFTDQTQAFRILTQELRLAGSYQRLKWLVGGNYEHDNLHEGVNSDLNSSNSVVLGQKFVNFLLHNDQSVDTKAVFASLDYDLGYKITLQSSARYTNQNRAYSGCLNGDGGPQGAALDDAFATLSSVLSGTPTLLGPSACIVLDPTTFKPVTEINRQLNQHNASWRAGASWKPTSQILVYGNATKGYKAGGFSSIPLVFTSEVTSVDQESVMAYEAGFKATLLDRKLQFNAAGFYYDYNNKQVDGRVVVPVFGDLPATVNIPASHIEGTEVDLAWQPIAPVKLTANGTYIVSRVDGNFVSADPLGKPVDFRGESLPSSPRFQFSGDAEYDRPLNQELTGYLGATVSHHDDTYALLGENPFYKLPAYTLLDLRAGVISDRGWTVEVFGRNVTDKYYLTNTALSTDAVVRYAGFPVTYGVRLTAHYR